MRRVELSNLMDERRVGSKQIKIIQGVGKRFDVVKNEIWGVFLRLSRFLNLFFIFLANEI